MQAINEYFKQENFRYCSLATTKAANEHDGKDRNGGSEIVKNDVEILMNELISCVGCNKLVPDIDVYRIYK